MANVDDTSSVVELEDIEFFCDEFVCLRKPLGATLAKKKTVIMTSCDGLSPLGLINAELGESVRSVIDC